MLDFGLILSLLLGQLLLDLVDAAGVNLVFLLQLLSQLVDLGFERSHLLGFLSKFGLNLIGLLLHLLDMKLQLLLDSDVLPDIRLKLVHDFLVLDRLPAEQLARVLCLGILIFNHVLKRARTGHFRVLDHFLPDLLENPALILAMPLVHLALELFLLSLQPVLLDAFLRLPVAFEHIKLVHAHVHQYFDALLDVVQDVDGVSRQQLVLLLFDRLLGHPCNLLL